MPIILAQRKLRQKDCHGFKASLVYVARPWHTKPKHKQKNSGASRETWDHWVWDTRMGREQRTSLRVGEAGLNAIWDCFLLPLMSAIRKSPGVNF